MPLNVPSHIPCPGCSAVAFLSGASVSTMVTAGQIVDGHVVRHLDGCRQIEVEVARLRRELGSTTRMLRAAITAFAVTGTALAYVTGLAHDRDLEARRWHRASDLAGVAQRLIDAHEQDTARMIQSQNESANAFLTELGHVMAVHNETMGRVTDVIEVVEAERTRLAGLKRATPTPPRTTPAADHE